MDRLVNYWGQGLEDSWDEGLDDYWDRQERSTNHLHQMPGNEWDGGDEIGEISQDKQMREFVLITPSIESLLFRRYI